ncbi:MAG: ABC transporter substrate-binding protein [Dehalococcoidia bacterium]
MRVRLAATFHSVFYAPYYVALNRGLFERAGVELEPVTFGDGLKVLAAMEAGDIDVGIGGIMRSLVRWDQGVRSVPIHFARVNDRDGFFLLGRPGPFAWPDLLDQRLMLFAEAPTPWYTMRAHLKSMGLDPARVQVMPPTPVDQVAAAFRGGATDFLETPAPVAEELVRDGVAVIHREMANETGPLPYSSYCARPELFSTAPDLLQAVARANIDALAWIRSVSGTAVWEAIRPSFPDDDPAIMQRAVERYHRLGVWHSDATIPHASFAKLADMLHRGDLISRVAPYDVCCDDAPTRAALAAGG